MWASGDDTSAEVIAAREYLGGRKSVPASLTLDDGAGNSQTIPLPAAAYFSAAKTWLIGANRPGVAPALTSSGNVIYLAQVELVSDGRAVLFFDTQAASDTDINRADLSGTMESSGTVTLTIPPP